MDDYAWTNVIKGTIAYFPPEYEPGVEVRIHQEKADIWSCGIVFI
jgi:hypothetical protein